MQSIQLEKVGNNLIKSSNDRLSVDEFSGSISYVIPIEITQARELTPPLALAYHPNVSRGCYGTGFSLSIPEISRSTNNGVPFYDNKKDIFFYNGEELVFFKEDNNRLLFRCRHEKEFSVIEFLIKESYWIIREPHGVNHIFGQSNDSRIDDPSDPQRVFSWKLEQTCDAKGNKIIYRYDKSKEDGNSYIKEILYGNYFEKNAQNSENDKTERFAYHVVFDYVNANTQLRTDNKNTKITKDTDKYNDLVLMDYAASSSPQFQKRSDPSYSFHSGFNIQTTRVCHNILLFHHFVAHDKNPFLVKRWSLHYVTTETNPLQQLKHVQRHGYKRYPAREGECFRKSVPAITLNYNGFEAPEFKPDAVLKGPAEVDSLDNMISFRFIDLYREGLPGIFYCDDYSAYYWRNKGDGTFSAPVVLENLPVDQHINRRAYQWLDIPEFDQMALLGGIGETAGYYLSLEEKANVETDQKTTQKGWGTFQPFTVYPNHYLSPNISEFVDVNSSGRADMVMFSAFDPHYYPSLGKEGFGEALPLSFDDKDDFPLTRITDVQELISNENIFGDGVSHRVRVTKDSIECWPNLGHGRFGKKIVLCATPNFFNDQQGADYNNDFMAHRLHFARVSGTGAADLVYVHGDRLQIFINTGLGFSPNPIEVKFPQVPSYTNPAIKEDLICTDLDRIQFVDLFGKGMSCLVLTKVDAHCKHYYIDFSAQRPYLLNKIQNGFGFETSLTYISSVQCYAEDLKSDRKLRYKCSFPVSVIQTISREDRIAHIKSTDRYVFHDGYYNPIERRFAGFGFVEHWDTDIDHDPTHHNCPTRYSKRWYHTGAYREGKGWSTGYQPDYFRNAKWLLGESTVPSDVKNYTPAECEQLAFALQGQLLRQEIYGDDGSDVKDIPYVTHENNFWVRCVQRQAGDGSTKNVFTVLAHEALTINYERYLNDPHIQREVNLAWDERNHLLDSCTIYYPREKQNLVQDPDALKYQKKCDKVFDEQKETKAVGSCHTYKPEVIVKGSSGQEFIFSGLVSESKTFDVTFVSDKEVKSSHDLAKQSAEKLIQHVSVVYCDDDKIKSSQLPLVHHTETFVENADKLNQIYAKYNTNRYPETFSPENAYAKAGFILKQNEWWNPSLVHDYDPDNFYLPLKIYSSETDVKSALWKETVITYDQYSCVITQVQNGLYHDEHSAVSFFALKNMATVDYDVVKPTNIIDMNANTTEIIFDPLGVVVASSHYGNVGKDTIGNFTILNRTPELLLELTSKELIEKPNEPKLADDLENYAGAIFAYNLFGSWNDEKNVLPASHAVKVREQYQQCQKSLIEQKSLESENFHLSIAYYDGLGDVRQMKARSEDAHWLVPELTIYNNKALAIKKFLPYYSKTYDYTISLVDEALMPLFASDAINPVTPLTFYYDGLNRLIESVNANGSKKTTVFHAWYRQVFDENDNGKSLNINDPKEGLDFETDYSIFEHTPSVSLFNVLGQAFQQVEIEKHYDEQSVLQTSVLTTHATFDMAGRVLSYADPRLHKKGLKNIQYQYDKQGWMLVEDSVDHGVHLWFYNRNKKPIFVLNSNGYVIETQYDNWNRKVTAIVSSKDKAPRVDEKIVYGEFDQSVQQNKSFGEKIAHYDQSGVTLFSDFDIDEHPGTVTRRLLKLTRLKDIPLPFDWRDIKTGSEKLETTTYVRQGRFDAMGKQVEQLFPDNDTVLRGEYNVLQQLNKLALVSVKSKASKDIITGIKYLATGKTEKQNFGNSTETNYTYSSKTNRLLTIETTQLKAEKKLQDIKYKYDLVGNITEIDDQSYKSFFERLDEPEDLLSKSSYKYDSAYRLKQAKSRAFVEKSSPTLFKELKGKKPSQMLIPYQENYAYDEGSNLETVSRTQFENDSPKKDWEKVYTVEDGSNRLKSEEIASKNISKQITHDGSGNQTGIGEKTALTWNAQDELTEINKPLDDEEYKKCHEFGIYDATGWCVRRVTVLTVKNDQSQKVFDEINFKDFIIKRELNPENLAIIAGAEKVKIRIHDGDNFVATYSPESKVVVYHLSNHLKSVCVEVNGEGELVTYEEYFPFGGTTLIIGRDEPAIKEKIYRYSGKAYDEYTGLYYYGARHYVPELSRWASADPARLVDWLNVYAFVNNNPITFFDSFGFQGTKRSRLPSPPPNGTQQPQELRSSKRHCPPPARFTYGASGMFAENANMLMPPVPEPRNRHPNYTLRDAVGMFFHPLPHDFFRLSQDGFSDRPSITTHVQMPIARGVLLSSVDIQLDACHIIADSAIKYVINKIIQTYDQSSSASASSSSSSIDINKQKKIEDWTKAITGAQDSARANTAMHWIIEAVKAHERGDKTSANLYKDRARELLSLAPANLRLGNSLINQQIISSWFDPTLQRDPNGVITGMTLHSREIVRATIALNVGAELVVTPGETVSGCPVSTDLTNSEANLPENSAAQAGNHRTVSSSKTENPLRLTLSGKLASQCPSQIPSPLSLSSSNSSTDLASVNQASSLSSSSSSPSVPSASSSSSSSFFSPALAPVSNANDSFALASSASASSSSSPSILLPFVSAPPSASSPNTCTFTLGVASRK